MSTDDILRIALYAGAEASDEIVPESGKHMRRLADELYPEKIEPLSHDPDHLNPAKGGNQASDDYW